MAGKVSNFSTKKLEKARPIDEKLARWARAKASSGLAWAHVPGKLLKAVLHVCQREGVSITFQPTRDGGAVAVRLWAGGEERREYAATAEELCELLEVALDALGNDTEDVLSTMAES